MNNLQTQIDAARDAAAQVAALRDLEAQAASLPKLEERAALDRERTQAQAALDAQADHARSMLDGAGPTIAGLNERLQKAAAELAEIASEANAVEAAIFRAGRDLQIAADALAGVDWQPLPGELALLNARPAAALFAKTWESVGGNDGALRLAVPDGLREYLDAHGLRSAVYDPRKSVRCFELRIGH